MTASYGAKYIRYPVAEGMAPLDELNHVWNVGTRSPEHARNWRTKIVREFPELADAIERALRERPDPEMTGVRDGMGFLVLGKNPHDHSFRQSSGGMVQCQVPGCSEQMTVAAWRAAHSAEPRVIEECG